MAEAGARGVSCASSHAARAASRTSAKRANARAAAFACEPLISIARELVAMFSDKANGDVPNWNASFWRYPVLAAVGGNTHARTFDPSRAYEGCATWSA